MGKRLETAIHRRIATSCDRLCRHFHREPAGSGQCCFAAACGPAEHGDGFKQFEPAPNESGIAGASALPGQPTTPERPVLARLWRGARRARWRDWPRTSLTAGAFRKRRTNTKGKADHEKSLSPMGGHDATGGLPVRARRITRHIRICT
jgi:hypothetical protein